MPFQQTKCNCFSHFPNLFFCTGVHLNINSLWRVALHVCSIDWCQNILWCLSFGHMLLMQRMGKAIPYVRQKYWNLSLLKQ